MALVGIVEDDQGSVGYSGCEEDEYCEESIDYGKGCVVQMKLCVCVCVYVRVCVSENTSTSTAIWQLYICGILLTSLRI